MGAKIWDDCFNLQAIAERLRNEAEDVESFADMMSAEIDAYYTFKREHKFYTMNMWEVAGTNDEKGVAVVGGVAMTTEEFSYEQFRELQIISHVEDGVGYIVEYKLGDYIQNTY